MDNKFDKSYSGPGILRISDLNLDLLENRINYEYGNNLVGNSLSIGTKPEKHKEDKV